MNSHPLRKIVFVISLLLGISLIILLFIHAATGNLSTAERTDDITDRHPVTPVDLPDKLDFAGEPVPLENFDVRESLDMELLINKYWQSHTLLLIKRANRHFPAIEKVLRENHIPDDLKYLAVAESDLMNLTSPSDAVGYWQFLEGTARELGLEVNQEVDERYHLEKSTEAACKFLKQSYELYGSWTMAAASYNAGRTGINRQIARQGTGYYYDLLLNGETGRYIYRILALKLILSDPGAYGFKIEDKDLYPVVPTYEVSLDTPVDDFAGLAQRYSINYKILKYFNPWLRETYLSNPGKKTYYIKVPVSGYRSFDPGGQQAD
jgi:membrane-bound lytic murein transglycosylase D